MDRNIIAKIINETANKSEEDLLRSLEKKLRPQIVLVILKHRPIIGKNNIKTYENNVFVP